MCILSYRICNKSAETPIGIYIVKIIMYVIMYENIYYIDIQTLYLLIRNVSSSPDPLHTDISKCRINIETINKFQ